MEFEQFIWFVYRYFLSIFIIATHISFKQSGQTNFAQFNLVDRTLDVRLSPVASEYCSINPCVAYGLKAVSTPIRLAGAQRTLFVCGSCFVDKNRFVL